MMNVDAKPSGVDLGLVGIQQVVSVSIAPDTDISISLTKSVVLSAMLVDLVDVSVLAGNQNSSASNAAGVLQPVQTRVGGGSPALNLPLQGLISVYAADQVVEDVGQRAV